MEKFIVNERFIIIIDQVDSLARNGSDKGEGVNESSPKVFFLIVELLSLVDRI